MIPYPTIEQVNAADRRQIYSWYLLLPVPMWIRDDKTKQRILNPPGGQEIIDRIAQRWEELGGHDTSIAMEIIRCH